MRRAAVILGTLVFAACGLDVLGRAPPPGDLPDAGRETGGGPGFDAAPGDAGLDAPNLDAGFPLPSNVDASLVAPDAGDLIGPSKIDTTNGEIDGMAPPPGVKLAKVGGGAGSIMVISVGKLTIDRELTVFGDLALVILASGPVDIGARIRVDATGIFKGPGGFASGLGPGAGAPGRTGAGADNSGGGGAGHAGIGGQGGAGGTAGATDGGIAYRRPLVGGSGGGRGDPAACALLGGAGGGAIQIFSLVGIEVSPLGGVHAGGGGGSGSSVAVCPSGSGPGGGSGGYILLEAPKIGVHGIVAANGGGGAGGDIAGGLGSLSGEDGPYGADAAAGSTGVQSTGGNGGYLMSQATNGGTGVNNGAGGGGAAGFIYFHFRGNGLDGDGGIVSPRADSDGGL